MTLARYATRTDNCGALGLGVWWLMDEHYRLLGWLPSLPAGDVCLEMEHGGVRSVVDYRITEVKVVRRYGAVVRDSEVGGDYSP